MSATDALEELIGSHFLRTATWSKPSGIYIGLFTVMPEEDGTGGTEVTGGNYARVQCGPGDAYWTGPTEGNGAYTNADAIQFATPSATWGEILGFGLFSAASSGTLYLSQAFDESVTVSNGDSAPGFASGSLAVTFA